MKERLISDKVKHLMELIRSKQTEQAIELIHSAEDYLEAKKIACAVMGVKEASSLLVDTALETFLSKRENRIKKHDYWVHSLSLFIERNLLEKRLEELKKKIQETKAEWQIERLENCISKTQKAIAEL